MYSLGQKKVGQCFFTNVNLVKILFFLWLLLKYLLRSLLCNLCCILLIPFFLSVLSLSCAIIRPQL
jgi:hypothetical protein